VGNRTRQTFTSARPDWRDTLELNCRDATKPESAGLDPHRRTSSASAGKPQTTLSVP
jgi:hypothetical protein